MNKKTFPLTLMGLLCVVAGQTATAGYILDGKEWEVRGTLASWTNHQTTQVPADTDWTWATKDDWDASGLEATALTDPDWSALMGALDGDSVQASAYLATTFSQNTELLAYYLLPSAGADATGGLMEVTANQFLDIERFRMSYRSVSVPVPPTLPLIGSSLVLVGWLRRKRI